MARLKDKYTEEIVPALKEKFQYNNIMEVPKLVKIVVNMGLGEAIACFVLGTLLLRALDKVPALRRTA